MHSSRNWFSEDAIGFLAPAGGMPHNPRLTSATHFKANLEWICNTFSKN
jgi:hypothetical protein